jgi:hypothetical protein
MNAFEQMDLFEDKMSHICGHCEPVTNALSLNYSSNCKSTKANSSQDKDKKQLKSLHKSKKVIKREYLNNRKSAELKKNVKRLKNNVTPLEELDDEVTQPVNNVIEVEELF